ncbi:MAG: hypothetical protein EXS03_03135 [Phycisphaerales bacterium]|nr:hypothetical protein [Phycisphaerales bacterium]
MINAASIIAQQAAAAPREEIYLFVSLGLLGLAVVLLVLELFVPTGGVLAVLTGVAAVASIASMFVYDTTWGGIYLALVCAGSPIAVILVFKVWSKTPIAHRMILTDGADGARRAEPHEESRSDPSRPAMGVAARAKADHLASFVGKHGTTATTLRPVGFVRIGAARLDAVAESGFIPQGSTVIVIEVVEGQLTVRETTERTSV